MNKKYKILLISDHPLSVSGVGTMARFLIEGLLKTNKYSFVCLGAAISHEKKDVIAVSPDFIIKPIEGFGNKELIRTILATEVPDTIMIFTDPRFFTFLWEIEDEIHSVCPLTYNHVWDGSSDFTTPTFNKPYYDSTDLINCISYPTYENVMKIVPDRTNYVPHAFPKNIFHSFSKEKIEQCREQHLGARKDWFLGLWVNRNAGRKMPSDVLECWSWFLKKLEKEEGHRNALLLMHTDPNDIEGPNLFAVAELLGVSNNVWFSPQRVGFEEMNVLYNMADFGINISRAEGFGLGVLQTLMSGKPVVVNKTGGMTRQAVDWRDGTEHGVAVDPIERTLVGSQLVPWIYDDIPDKKKIAEGIWKVYKYTDKEKEELKTKILSYIDFEYNYDKMISDWDRTLEKTMLDWKAGKLPNNKKWSLESIETPAMKYETPQQAQQELNKIVKETQVPLKKKIDISSLIAQKQKEQGK